MSDVANQFGFPRFALLCAEDKAARLEKWVGQASNAFLRPQGGAKRVRQDRWSHDLDNLKAAARRARKAFQKKRKRGANDVKARRRYFVLRKRYLDAIVEVKAQRW